MIRSLFHNVSVFRGSLHPSRRYVRQGRDPGINKRLKVFSADFVESDPDSLENLESDFMNVADAHKEFDKEEQQFKRKVGSMIVGQKYFNDKGVNFLTFAEKEQIRMLNQKDPQKYTADELSNSFPADPFAISKIIKNRWQPSNEKKLQKHDASVKANWQKFKKGELEVEPILAEHLKKFAHRDFNNIQKPKLNKKLGTEIPKPASNEFSSIITSCKKYQEEPEKPEEKLKLTANELTIPKNLSKNPEKDSFLLEGKLSNPVTEWIPLQEYQKHATDIDVQIRENERDKRSRMELKVKETSDDSRFIQKHEPGVTSLDFDYSKVFKSLEIKENIKIPKKLWKKDQVYKVDDCFYADDGEFLFRVPGLR